MTDFLTQRSGTWHFVRRVPAAYAKLDVRGIVCHSTRIRVAEDRLGRRAARVADRLNAGLELHWRELADGQSQFTLVRYDEARRKARALGLDYLPHDQLITLPAERLLERLESLVSRGAADDPAARAALLGTEKRPAFPLSRLFEEYERTVRDEIRDLSPDQLRIWRNGRIRAVEQRCGLRQDQVGADWRRGRHQLRRQAVALGPPERSSGPDRRAKRSERTFGSAGRRD